MDALLGERLNNEPVVFRGYTDSELLLAIAVSAGFWFPLALVAGFFAGSISMALGMAMLAVIRKKFAITLASFGLSWGV